MNQAQPGVLPSSLWPASSVTAKSGASPVSATWKAAAPAVAGSVTVNVLLGFAIGQLVEPFQYGAFFGGNAYGQLGELIGADDMG